MVLDIFHLRWGFSIFFGFDCVLFLTCEERSGNHPRAHKEMLTVSVIERWWLLRKYAEVGYTRPALKYLSRVWKDRTYTQGIWERVNN